jgi:hypothetical protein
MFDPPHRAVIAVADDRQLGDTFTLHAVLYRLCASHATALDNCLKERTWDDYAAEVAARTRLLDWRDARRWRRAIRKQLRRLGEAGREQAVVGCGAVLRALDDYHKDLRTELQYQEVPVGERYGGGVSVLLPPPGNPIARAIEAQESGSRPLSRRLDHQRHDVQWSLGLYWRVVSLGRHAVRPRFFELEAAAAGRLAARLAGGELRVGLASPFADLGYEFDSEPARCHRTKGVPYRFVNMKSGDREAARGTLDDILADAAEHRVDVLCFPELTLDNDLLRHFRDRLKSGSTDHPPAVTVAGSFHLSHRTRWVNRCHVLDARGRIVFVQDKCKEFQLTPELAAASPDLCREMGIEEERGGYEGIDCAAGLEVADTPIGRLVTPICLDFCGEEIRELLIDSRVNLYLVPAMTPRMGDFRRRARDLGTLCRGSSFVVNSAWLLERIGRLTEERLFLGYLPEKRSRDPRTPQRISKELRLFSIRVQSKND